MFYTQQAKGERFFEHWLDYYQWYSRLSQEQTSIQTFVFFESSTELPIKIHLEYNCNGYDAIFTVNKTFMFQARSKSKLKANNYSLSSNQQSSFIMKVQEFIYFLPATKFSLQSSVYRKKIDKENHPTSCTAVKSKNIKKR